jgi:phosphoglycerate dehydrogenase-like enzyme
VGAVVVVVVVDDDACQDPEPVRLHVHYPDADAIATQTRGRAGMWTCTTDADALAAALPEIEYLFSPVPPRGIWATASRLRLLQLAGAGADGLLPAPDLPASVEVCSARGLFAAEASDYAIAAMLAIWRRIPRLLEQQRAHAWARVAAPALQGRILGVLGFGEIGRRVAHVGSALGMRVVAARRRPALGTGRSDPHASTGDLVATAVEVVGPDQIPDVVAAADCLVVALPLTAQTRRLLDREILATLRPGAVVVAISRGGIVDAHALADLARRGRIRGAAIDVFEREPLPPDDPLWDSPGVLVSPHEAGFGEDYLARAIDLFVANAQRIARGEPPRGRVERAAGY